MTLQTGGEGVRFKPKPLSGVELGAVVEPDFLLLDGQHCLTSLFQVLLSGAPVDTTDARGKRLQRRYLIDIRAALSEEGDREEAILSVPSDLVVKADFNRTVVSDYSTVEKQCEAGVFPLGLVFDNAARNNWQQAFWNSDKDEHPALWNRFWDRVLENFLQYTIPVIQLDRSTSKEAVCTVFEKVNTGGVPLNVFELLTAVYAGDHEYYTTHGTDFRLNLDWADRRATMANKPVLESLESTDFLQAISLLASSARRATFLEAGGDPTQAPGVTCKRKDILKLELSEYLAWADAVTQAMLWASTFLAEEHVFRAQDLPYRTQLVPIAAAKVALGQVADTYSGREKLRRWYWSGVLGELYGGTTETRFARDFEQLVPWIRDSGPAPGTVVESSFHEQRLLTLKTRGSAAYKGMYALLMRKGCYDWAHVKPLHLSTFHNYSVDIHHVFPKAWCKKNHIDDNRRESIVNKTPLSKWTNQVIGGASPKDYLRKLEVAAKIDAARVDSLVASHDIDPSTLRDADFDSFFASRKEALLTVIEEATGKAPVRSSAVLGEAPEQFVSEPEDDDEDYGDEERSAGLDEDEDFAVAAPAEHH